eukprot:3401182-Rhodomonas_salina.2
MHQIHEHTGRHVCKCVSDIPCGMRSAKGCQTVPEGVRTERPVKSVCFSFCSSCKIHLRLTPAPCVAQNPPQ